MGKRMLAAGVLGATAMGVWYAFMNVVFGFTLRTQMTPVPNERAVYDLLTRQPIAPGAYLVNPALVNGMFPDGAPVFSIRTAGFGHEMAGSMLLVHLALWVANGIIAAWLLSHASSRVLARYLTRMGFVTGFGVVAVFMAILPQCGIGGLPMNLTLLIAANHMAGWFMCALVVAHMVRDPGAAALT